jgi:hypothetical protein
MMIQALQGTGKGKGCAERERDATKLSRPQDASAGGVGNAITTSPTTAPLHRCVAASLHHCITASLQLQHCIAHTTRPLRNGTYSAAAVADSAPTGTTLPSLKDV